jgi:hypothetical protein
MVLSGVRPKEALYGISMSTDVAEVAGSKVGKGHGYGLQPGDDGWGSHRSAEPVSSMTPNAWGGVPTEMLTR